MFRRLLLPLPASALLLGCSPSDYKDDADQQVYGLLENVSRSVTGESRVERLERPVDTLRKRILAASTPMVVTIAQALDIAAENSREFQRQKEQLYLVGLALTQQEWNFSTRWSFTGTEEVTGVGDDEAVLSLRNQLRASRNTESGANIVVGFVNNWLKNLVSGANGWDPSSLLSLSITQPLLAGAGKAVAREPLTQAERNVIYQVRDYERFRATQAVRVVTEYYRVLEQMDNLRNEEANAVNLRQNREQTEALAEAGRRTSVDLDRARQDELSANDRLVTARAQLESTLDRFRVLLGLPTDAQLTLDIRELEHLRADGAPLIALEEPKAIELALLRRFDYRNVVDEVEDAGRGILVAEDALESSLDLVAAADVPTDRDKAFRFDWSKVNWSAGFQIDLAIDRLPQRNAYRAALIDMDVAIRSREQLEDTIKQEVREALRNIRRTAASYEIQSRALILSERRVESTRDLYAAGRSTALDLLDAQESLLQSQLQLTGALIDHAVARLNLLRDLEGLVLEPKGLRYDPGLPIPTGPRPELARHGTPAGADQRSPLARGPEPRAAMGSPVRPGTGPAPAPDDLAAVPGESPGRPDVR
ncbi:MAG: TolC family protein [Planctomycetes bacterium]|nr:TolC family protein [Planctomycetota bacterium]